MRRGKRFIDSKNDVYIYIGTAIFIVLAIAFGIIMYMLTRTATKLENQSGKIAQEQQEQQSEAQQQDISSTEKTTDASTEIGKTVEEAGNTVKNTVNATNTAEPVKTEESTNTNNSKTTKENTGKNATDSKSDKSSKTQKTKEVDEPDSTANNVNNNASSAETKKEVSFIKPTEGEIICEFAKDNLIYSETLKEWITHTAIDIKADKTSVIKSAADGIVRSIVNDPRYGLTVIIEHDDGYETVYSNLLTAEFVVEGEEVKQGQTIGTVGNTAAFESEMECHLHFELLKDGEYVDPSIYLK